MDNKELLEKIYDKLEKLVDEVAELKVVSAKQEVNLQIHMQRSDLLEEQVSIMRDTYNKDKEEIEKQLKPVQEHITGVKVAFKIGSLVAGVMGVVLAIAQILQILKANLL